jgi:anti-sigma B factor antagonist
VGRGGGFYQELAVELTVTRHEGYALARISGPLDESARPAFREQLHPLIAERGTRLIVDLSSSQRINSPGIGNLVALVADANTNDSKVIFAAPTAFIAGVLSVTKLDTYFDVAPTLEEAIRRASAA